MSHSYKRPVNSSGFFQGGVSLFLTNGDGPLMQKKILHYPIWITSKLVCIQDRGLQQFQHEDLIVYNIRVLRTRK